MESLIKNGYGLLFETNLTKTEIIIELSIKIRKLLDHKIPLKVIKKFNGQNQKTLLIYYCLFGSHLVL